MAKEAKIKSTDHNLYGVIKEAKVSEKSLRGAKLHTYTFVVDSRTNKVQVRKALETLHGLSVKSVNIVNLPEKPKNFGRTRGMRAGIKKAIVTLSPNSKTPDFIEA